MLLSRKRQFVFVSHANKDKSAIKPLIDALIGGGLKVWLDSPERMGYSTAEIEAHFIDLRGGRKWRDQIYDAANEAMCLLVCWSKTSAGADREIIRDEVAVGRSQGKLIACRIDDVDPQSLPNQLGDEQIIDLWIDPGAVGHLSERHHERCRRLVEDVRAVMTRISSARTKADDPRDTFVPYLVNRRTQEAAASNCIRNASEGLTGAVFVFGPRNECVDQFRERLTRYTSADCLANGRSWQEILVDWPPTNDPSQFAEMYQAALAVALRVRVQDVPAKLVQPRLAPLAVVSVIGMSQWGRRQRELMHAWLRFWRRTASLGREVRIVPILAVEMPEAKPGWSKVPPLRTEGVSAARIWKDVGEVAKSADRDPTCIPLTRLDALSPVCDDDARHWLRIVIRNSASLTWRRLDLEIDRVFSGAGRRGVAMKDFAETMRAAIAQHEDS